EVESAVAVQVAGGHPLVQRREDLIVDQDRQLLQGSIAACEEDPDAIGREYDEVEEPTPSQVRRQREPRLSPPRVHGSPPESTARLAVEERGHAGIAAARLPQGQD